MREYVDVDGVIGSQAEYRAGLLKRPVRTRIVGFEDSKVDQSQAADADLNVLVKRWMRGEPVPQFEAAQFGDVSESVSFQDMQERLIVVEEMFASLPADVRAHFANSPVVFADAMVDSSRVDELVKLGVLKTAADPQPPVEAAPVKPLERQPEGAGSGGA